MSRAKRRCRYSKRFRRQLDATLRGAQLQCLALLRFIELAQRVVRHGSEA